MAIIGFLGGPVIKGLIEAYNVRLKAGNVSEKIAADLAASEIMVQQSEIDAQTRLKIAQLGRWYEPEKLFAYIMVIYFGKIVLWDKVLSAVTGGSTDPITGEGAAWAGMIMAFYMGKRGFENVATILRAK